jgi:hypothetical protein
LESIRHGAHYGKSLIVAMSQVFCRDPKFGLKAKNLIPDGQQKTHGK